MEIRNINSILDLNFSIYIPLKRYGKVNEISSVIELLASEGGSYITGQNIRVDGGLTKSV